MNPKAFLSAGTSDRSARRRPSDPLGTIPRIPRRAPAPNPGQPGPHRFVPETILMGFIQPQCNNQLTLRPTSWPELLILALKSTNLDGPATGLIFFLWQPIRPMQFWIAY